MDLNTAKIYWPDIAYPPGKWIWRIFVEKKCQHFLGKCNITNKYVPWILIIGWKPKVLRDRNGTIDHFGLVQKAVE